MISKIKGILVKKEENKAAVEISGLVYEIHIPETVSCRITALIGEPVEFIVYHFLTIDQSRGLPVLIGFIDDLEKEFFEKFISVSGIGPKAAIKAFTKPIPAIAAAIENADEKFLRSLDGIGGQKAKQIIASLQGKVGRFALLKEKQDQNPPKQTSKTELIEEVTQVLKRLGYTNKEIDEMTQKALTAKPQIVLVEDLLNEIYRQKK